MTFDQIQFNEEQSITVRGKVKVENNTDKHIKHSIKQSKLIFKGKIHSPGACTAIFIKGHKSNVFSFKFSLFNTQITKYYVKFPSELN